MILRCSALASGGSQPSVRHFIPIRHHPPHLSTFATPSKGLKLGFSLRCFRSTITAEESPADLPAEKLSRLSPKEITVLLGSQKSCRSSLDLLYILRSLPHYEPNIFHYNVVFRSLGVAGEWGPLRRLWLDMSLDGVRPDPVTYSILMDAYERCGLSSHALLWLRHMLHLGIFPDELALCSILRILRDSDHLPAAIRLFLSWSEGTLDLDYLNRDPLFDVNDNTTPDNGGPGTFLLSELSGLRNRPSPPRFPCDRRNPRLASTYNTIIDLYGRSGKLEESYLAFEKMLKSGVAPDTVTLNTMIGICGSRGGTREAEELLQKMKERKVWPNIRTFNILMSSCSSRGDADGIMRNYRNISVWKLRPDKITYLILLRFLCLRGMFEEAESSIEEMELQNVEVDEQLLPFVTKMYVSKGLPYLGKKFLEKHCFGKDVSSSKYAAIIAVYGDEGLWEDAEDVFLRRMRCCQGKMDVAEFNAMVRAYGKGKLYDKALSLFDYMVESGIVADASTYNSLVQILSKGGLFDDARQILAEMCDAGFGSQCEAFYSIIGCCTQLGLDREAEQLFAEMKRHGVEPNEVVYGALINLFAQLGRAEDALRYYKLMEESGIHANQIVLTSLIKAYSKTGRWKEAEELYAKMHRLEGGADVIASNCMINLYSKLEMVTPAEAIFDSLRESGRADNVSYFTMMRLYQNLGMPFKLAQVVDDMQQQPGLLADSRYYTELIAFYASVGDLRKSGQLLHHMREVGIFPDGRTFRVIFRILKKSWVFPEVVKQLKESYFDKKPYAKQATICCFFSVARLPIYACKTCESFLTWRGSLDLFAYNAAIFTYTCSHETERALNLLPRMRSEGLKPDIVTNIHLTKCYADAGLLHGIMEIHHKLLCGEAELTKSLFRAVCFAYQRLGNFALNDKFVCDMKFRL